MLGWKRQRNTYYYGSSAYKYVDDLISKKGDILIVSPYIDRYYAELILKKSKGSRFYVISSSIEGRALEILGDKHSQLWLIGYLALSAIMFWLAFSIGIRWPYLLISLVPLAIGAIKHLGRGSKMALKVPRKFVHAKMYISDGMAITGSANLTYSGTHKNSEHINIIYDEEEISRLKDQFWEIWRGI
ncbi:MAG: phospholipase D-like domain-containing protein [Candidatus Micrarchaeaceae archaeon]